MGLNKKRLTVWLMVVIFAAVGHLLSFQWWILRNLLISFQIRKTRRKS